MVSPMRPALAAAYAGEVLGLPMRAEIELIVTILPLRRSIMCGSTALMHHQGPLRSTSISLRQWASSISHARPRGASMPALLTRPSTPPKVVESSGYHCFSQPWIGDIDRDGLNPSSTLAERGSDAADFHLLDIGKQECRTVGRESAGDTLADSLGRSGDNSDSVGQFRHEETPLKWDRVSPGGRSAIRGFPWSRQASPAIAERKQSRRGTRRYHHGRGCQAESGGREQDANDQCAGRGEGRRGCQ